MGRGYVARMGRVVMTILVVGIFNVILFSIPTDFAKRASHSLFGATYLGRAGVLLQTNPNACGPAALQMVFDHYGVPSSLKVIEKEAGMSERGTTMRDLKRVAESKGLASQAWSLTMNDLAGSSFPTLLFVREDHFVVADSFVHGEIYLRDPAIGKIRMSERALSRIWSGETLLFAAPNPRE